MQNYLIVSNSYYLALEKVKDIIQDSQNVLDYNLSNDQISDIINEASYVSFIDDTKYLIIKNANIFGNEKLKEEESLLLLKYLNNPNEQVVLIFIILDKIDNRKSITKIMKEKYQLIDIPKLTNIQLNNKIKDLFKGYKIDLDTIKYIASASLNNYDLVYNEVNKIKMYYNNQKQIFLSDVKHLVAANIEDNIFKFINAVILKDNQSFNFLNDLKLIKQEPVMLITLLAKEYRNMYIVKNLKNAQEAIDLAKIKDWQYNNYIKNSSLYSNKELKDNLHKLYELDLKIKSGKIQKYLGLELFILEVI